MHSFRDVKMEGQASHTLNRQRLMSSESLRGVLRSWQELASLSRQRKVALAQADKERAANLMKETFGRWRSRHRDRCLQPVVSSHRRAELQGQQLTSEGGRGCPQAGRRDHLWSMGYLEGEIQGAPRLPHHGFRSRAHFSPQKLHAVSMDSRRVKRMAWTRWQRAVELAVQAKQAKASADRHLLGEFSWTDDRSVAYLNSLSGEVFATWKDAAKQKASRKTT